MEKGRRVEQVERTEQELEQVTRDFVLHTLGAENGDYTEAEFVERFDDLLFAAVRSLPRYTELRDAVAEVAATARQDLPFAIFEHIRRAADTETAVENDGVLISSMQAGHLECAGRVLIASVVLEEYGVPFSKIQAPGHSMLLARVDSDTLAYMDPNNNLYFTLPVAGLHGFEGTDTTAECTLVEAHPDAVSGNGTPYTQFLVLPAREGNGRTYLDNCKAALAGNAEFSESGFSMDLAAAEKMDTLLTTVYGENDVSSNFRETVPQRIIELENGWQADQQFVLQVFNTSTDQHIFVERMVAALSSELKERIPYIASASQEQQKAYMLQMYTRVQEYINQNQSE